MKLSPALALSFLLGSVLGDACTGSPLTAAAAEGNIKTLAALLSSAKTTCDPVSQALFCALDTGKISSVMTLLENQKAIDCLKDDLTSPLDLALIKAASMPDEQMANKAFAMIIKLAKSERIAFTWLAKSKAILGAAKKGYDSIADLTEIHKDSSFFFPADLQEALEEASRIPGDKMLKTAIYIMKSEPLVNPAASKYKALYNACRAGNSELVRYFLADDRVDPSINDGFAVLLAVDAGSYDTVLALLEDDRIDPASRNNQCFITAVEKGYLEIAKLLAEDIRVDPTARHSVALLKAIENDDAEMLVFLLEDTNADPTVGKLVRASLDKKPIILHILLYEGRAIPTIDDLLYCVFSQKYQHIRLLLKDGRVDPNEQNGAAIQLVGKMGLNSMFWDFLHDPRVDITVNNGGLLRETLENANSFGHKVILLTLLHDERFAKFIASRSWIKSLKGPIWRVAEHLLWFAHHFWKLRRDGKEPKVPEAYKPLVEIPNARVMSLWLNKISSAYESAEIEETMAVLKKYARTWQNGVTEQFRAPDDFMLSRDKGKETENNKKKRSTESKSSYSSETDSRGSPRRKNGSSKESSSASMTPTSQDRNSAATSTTSQSSTSSTTSSFSVPSTPNSSRSGASSSSSTNGTPRTPELTSKGSSGDFIHARTSRSHNGMQRK